MTRTSGAAHKSAIRTDWRTERRSAVQPRAPALGGLCRLVDALPARRVLLSYSTDGNIPAADLLAALAARGGVDLCTRRYKTYRVSTPRLSPAPTPSSSS